MNQVLPTLMTVDEFLRWSVRQEQGRYELEGGRVIAMPAETAGHVLLKHVVHDALVAAIKRAAVPYFSWQNGMAVRVGEGRTFEPDILVAPLPYPAKASLVIENPVIVVEVLSPSTMRRDLTTKVAGYALVASIEHYVVIDPEERAVLHFRRKGDALAPPEQPVAADGVLRLEPPGLEVPVIELLGPEPAA